MKLNSVNNAVSRERPIQGLGLMSDVPMFRVRHGLIGHLGFSYGYC